MTCNWGENCSPSFLQAIPSSRILEGLFQLTLRPSRALSVAFGTSDICHVYCTRRAGPRTLSKTNKFKLDYLSVDSTLSYKDS